MKLTKTMQIAATFLFVAAFGIGARPICAQIVDVGQVEKQVWSGYWWPTYKGEIVQPLKKYDKLTGAGSADWHKRHNPRNAARWEGLCHAWSAASVSEIEPTRPVEVNGMKLGVGDQKAWLTVCHDSDVANFYGDRYGDGSGSEDLEDVRPDEFWQTLRSYIRDRKIPVIADIAYDAPVWNYPIYAYRVNIAPVDGGTLHRGTFEIWLADDAVKPDFVGVKRVYKKYRFEIEIRDGSIVAGSGKWIGASVKDHPDFVWIPYVVQTSNPEMNYAKVCELLGRSQAEFPDARQDDAQEELEPNNGEDENGNNDDGNNDENNNNDGNDDENNNDDGNDDENNNDDGNDDENNDDGKQARLREFIDSLENYETPFPFGFNAIGWKTTFEVGELLRFDVGAESDGYLYLFSVNPGGRIEILYPAFEDVDNHWKNSSDIITVPNEKERVQIRATEPTGAVRVVAVIAANPLNFDALKVPEKSDKQDLMKLVEENANGEGADRKVDAKTENEILGWNDTTIYVTKAGKPDKGKKQ